MGRAVVISCLLLGVAVACSGGGGADRLGLGAVELSEALVDRDQEEPALRLVVPTGDPGGPVRVTVELVGLRWGRPGTAEDLAVLGFVTVDAPCVPAGTRYPESLTHVPVDSSGGAELTLAPGEHRLCAQATDGFGTVTSLVDEVSVTVSEPVFRLAPIAG